MKLVLRVRDPFHLEGHMLERAVLLTDKQAKLVRKNNELLRRCTQEAAHTDEQTALAQAPEATAVERRKPNARDTQE